MTRTIEELLHRRSDLGTFLVHLTRDGSSEARQNLLDILVGNQIEARNPMGIADRYFGDRAFADTQKVVCFTETPLEHIWMMCEDIEGRSVKMKPYGLVFTKTWARRRGVNPVLYADITKSGTHDWLTKAFDELLESAAAGYAVRKDINGSWGQVPLAESAIARLTPFVEPMGQPDRIRREWWWEREWRHVGDLQFNFWDIVVVLVPENDHPFFEAEFKKVLVDAGVGEPLRPLRFLDPWWGQERMIASLAAVPKDNVGPFPK